jgi:polyisoprenoid-binding protein YceI
MNQPSLLRPLGTLAALCLIAATVAAAPLQFDFKDPKGVNSATFLLDAPLEAISGVANGVSGTVTFDPANPAALTGFIAVTTASLQVPNPVMKDHMLGKDWLDAEAHPAIRFEAVKLSDVKTVGPDTTATVAGRFTLKGVTREVAVPVKITLLRDKLGARTNGQVQGDLLVIRGSFNVKRSDFNVNAKAPVDKVADEVRITLSLAGAAPRS